jgi:hypothetical protein
MAAIPAVPIFIRDALLTLKVGAAAAGEYQCFAKIAAVKVTPGDVVTVQTLCSDGTFSSTSKASYALVLEGLQDWSATGLSAYLWTNDGEVADFVLNAYGEDATASASTPSMTGKVTLASGDYGGEVDTYGEFALELACTEKPVLVTV